MKLTFKQDNLMETPIMAIRCKTNIRDIRPKGRSNITAKTSSQTQITTANKATNRTNIVTKRTKKNAARAAPRRTTTKAAITNAITAIKLILVTRQIIITSS